MKLRNTFPHTHFYCVINYPSFYRSFRFDREMSGKFFDEKIIWCSDWGGKVASFEFLMKCKFTFFFTFITDINAIISCVGFMLQKQFRPLIKSLN